MVTGSPCSIEMPEIGRGDALHERDELPVHRLVEVVHRPKPGDLRRAHRPVLLHPRERVARRKAHEDEHQHDRDGERGDRLRDPAKRARPSTQDPGAGQRQSAVHEDSGRMVTSRNRRFTPKTNVWV